MRIHTVNLIDLVHRVLLNVVNRGSRKTHGDAPTYPATPSDFQPPVVLLRDPHVNQFVSCFARPAPTKPAHAGQSFATRDFRPDLQSRR